MDDGTANPAQLAAQESWSQLQYCLDNRISFIFEAGAGAGKTYSLIQALRHLVNHDGLALMRRNQQVACITYTNVATNEIQTRTDKHPAVSASTIHAFCWSLIGKFQPFLRKEVPTIKGWKERIEEAIQSCGGEPPPGAHGPSSDKSDVEKADPEKAAAPDEGVGNRIVEYNLGYPRVEKRTISLGHNDVLVLTAKLLEQSKFRQLLANRHPVVLIDEYQDTDKVIFEALRNHVIGSQECPLFGFFGDHWQKIYGTGCGRIEHSSLKVIGKKANFRSVRVIVNLLNEMRPELPQEIEDPNAAGSVDVFHTNAWAGIRRSEAHWTGDLPPEVAHQYLQHVTEKLMAAGWDFSPQKSKILMLTHNILASEQGYQDLADVFPRNESFIKKEDPHVAFLVDTFEPFCQEFERKRYGDMFGLLGERRRAVRSHADKEAWDKHIATIATNRQNRTIGAVLDQLRRGGRIPIPEAVDKRETELEKRPEPIDPGNPDEIERLRTLRAVPYRQIVALSQFIDEKTPFSTKHGVKGAEFENVLVVFGRGWNLYNFNQFLELASLPGVPADKEATFERNRNLFYVACSRPKRRLALLFTQELSNAALATLVKWCGADALQSLPAL